MPRREPFKSALMAYLEELRMQGYSERTIEDYSFASLKACQILKAKRLSTNPRKIGKPELLAIAEAWQDKTSYWRNFRPFLHWCENFNDKKLRLRFPRTQGVNVDWLDPDEEHSVRTITEYLGTPLQRMVMCLELDHGLRRVECQRLRLRSVKKDHLVVHGKGKKTRPVPLNDGFVDVHREYIRWRTDSIERTKTKNPKTKVPDTLLIWQRGSRVGTPKDTCMDNIIKGISERSGVHFSHHTLRRTFGRNMWKADVQIEAIAFTMGHESIDQTLKYLGIRFEDAKEGMKRLSEYQRKNESHRARWNN
jgi:site-specific recombinase XerD